MITRCGPLRPTRGILNDLTCPADQGFAKRRHNVHPSGCRLCLVAIYARKKGQGLIEINCRAAPWSLSRSAPLCRPWEKGYTRRSSPVALRAPSDECRPVTPAAGITFPCASSAPAGCWSVRSRAPQSNRTATVGLMADQLTVDGVDGCVGRPAGGRRWKSATVKT